MREHIETWNHANNDGEEATGAPPSAPHFRLLSAAIPFVDFGAWRHTVPLWGASRSFPRECSHPRETSRRKHSPGQGPTRNGPERTMQALDSASRTRLKRYLDFAMPATHGPPCFLSLIACADHNMHQLHVECIGRRVATGRADLTSAGHWSTSALSGVGTSLSGSPRATLSFGAGK